MINIITMVKNWWRPHRFTVTYRIGFGMLQDYHDKFTYNNLDDAKKRRDYLSSLSNDVLLAEGFLFIPNYIGIKQVSGPNPLRRFLNMCGSKRMYKIFGYGYEKIYFK